MRVAEVADQQGRNRHVETLPYHIVLALQAMGWQLHLLERPHVTKAHLAASYQIGDAENKMVEITDKACKCGLRLVPLLGKVMQGTTIRWDVWIEGSYEHVTQPEVEHLPEPIGDWTSGN